MIAFLFYNADFLDIAEHENESTNMFVDDSFVAIVGNDFEETTTDLSHFMCWNLGHYNVLRNSRAQGIVM
jgi:hypothetical protein